MSYAPAMIVLLTSLLVFMSWTPCAHGAPLEDLDEEAQLEEPDDDLVLSAPADKEQSSPAKPPTEVAIGATKFFGLGVIGGDPNGLSGKLYLGSRTHAVDFALAYRLWGPNGSAYYAHSTYLVHPNEFRELDGVVLSWHMGIGGYLAIATVDLGDGQSSSALGLGARAPIGIDFDLEAFPLQFFVDVALNIGLIPTTYASAEGNLGLRYYFK
jgi:hypothetical protein